MIPPGPRLEPGVRVLVVDDQPASAGALGGRFRTMGCRVEVAHGGLDGFRRASRGDFDLIALDSNMSGLSGLEALRAMAMTGLEARIVVVGADPSGALAAECLASGAAAVVAGPEDLLGWRGPVR